MVGKLVVFKIGEGNFETGFPVTLQIGNDGQPPAIEITGRLPPSPDLPQLYEQWQSIYLQLGGMRLNIPAAQVTNVSILEECENAAQPLIITLKNWLNQASVRDLREHILEEVKRDEPVRIILQTNDLNLQRLPWHLWDLFERRPQAEIALCAEYALPSKPLKGTVNILAILGNSDGINVQTDRILWQQLPQAKITWLITPTRQQLNEQLWQGNWDILFFAGHSFSQHSSEVCQIQINDRESLSIEQLKYGLKTAVEKGLKLAIFNSCDGLGLARELATLHIPQTIVMREPVPDPVAQAFLKYFLALFSQGEPFYLAVRKAREQLQGMEGDFPCATWLPIIYQNPAETPLKWPIQTKQRWKVGLKATGAIAAGILTAILLAKLPTQKPVAGSDRVSLGDKILITADATPAKQVGIKAFATGNFDRAIAEFQSSLNVYRNDPEALIYLNNAKAAKAGRMLRIAVSVPIGGNLNIAKEMLRGVAQVQDEVNRSNGINGSLLQIKIANDDNSPEIAAKQIAPQLVEDNLILAVVGHNASEVSIEAAPVYQKNGLVAISPTSSATQFSGMGSYTFRTVPSSRIDGNNLANYAIKKADKTKVAICTDSRSPYSESLKIEFTNAVLQEGGRISSISCDFANPTFNPNTTISNTIADGADGLLLLPSVERINQAIDLAKVNKGRLALFSGSTMYTFETLQLGQVDVNGMVLAVVWHPVTIPNNLFLDRAKRLWGGAVNWRTAMAYDATQAIVAA